MVESLQRGGQRRCVSGFAMPGAFFEWFGEIGFFCGRVFRAAVTPPYEIRELIRQLDEIGSKSAFLVLLAGAAIGVVLSLETRNSLIRFGAKSSLPAIIMISIVTESGRGHRSRAGLDEGHGSNRRDGSLGRQSLQVPGINPHFGMCFDASVAHAGS